MRATDVDTDFIFTGLEICELLCVIPEHNKRRFYRVEVSQGLWCPIVIRAWGRIGSSVRVKLEFFESLEEALAVANRLLRKRVKRGYHITTESLVENAVPVHPVEIKNIRIRRKDAEENLSFPFFQRP